MEIFSRFGLVHGMSSVFALVQQLTREYGEGFTPEQANVGLAAVGYESQSSTRCPSTR